MIFGSLSVLAQTLVQFPVAHKVGVMGLSAVLFALSFDSDNPDEKTPSYNETHTLLPKAHAEGLHPASIVSYQPPPNTFDITDSALQQAIEEKNSPTPEISALANLETNLQDKQLSPEPTDLNTYISETVKPGDTLTTVFERASVSLKSMYELLHGHPKANALAKIHPGHSLNFVVNEAGQLIELQHVKNPLNQTIFKKTDSGFEYELVSQIPDIKLVRAEGIITSSLYEAAKVAQLEDRLTMSLANIFGWDVDFVLDIRKNDSFTVVYEEKYLNGKLLGTGDIIAAEFNNQGKTYRAVRYTDSTGDTQYYTPVGDTMRKAFLRSPIEFARISSHFNLNRKHPILNTIRAHKGTDYAAPIGTPIKAAGDGKVIFAGVKGGYGNVLIVQHGQKYETRYAHLKSFANGVKRGRTVKQGQTVAYVGMTGLSSGPHLHYEFRVNGAVRNPVTVELPKANPIAKSERSRFFATTQTLVAKLDNPENSKTKIAQKESAAGEQPATM